MRIRILTSIILLAIFIPLIIIGGFPFEIACTILSVLSIREILNLLKKEDSIPFFIEIFSYFLVAFFVLSSESVMPYIALIILFLFVPLVFVSNKKYNIDIALKVFGLTTLIGYIYYNISNIRLVSLDDFVYIVLISGLTDTFAYIGGKTFGKRKLAERVSPNKTIEGSVIGTIVGTIIPSIYYLYMIDPGASMFIVIIITLVLSVFGQLGDLVFSSIKRKYNVKDYSNIIPGHGGIMDRFDSLLFIAITFIVIKAIIL